MPAEDGPLAGRTALVTGVSRRRGIGFAVARRLARDGADLAIGHWAPHDARQPWGSDDLDAVRGELRAALRPGATLSDHGVDLGDADAATGLVEAAAEPTGRLDVLVANQALSEQDGSLLDVTAEDLDRHWQVNARATVLMTSAFARRRSGPGETSPARPGDRPVPAAIEEHETGRVVWITSGQARPMPGEVGYAASKAVLAGLVPTVAAELLPRGILLNAVNPGPVNTGYLDVETTDRSTGVLDEVRARMPLGRFGEPGDVARLIAWLVSDEGRWVIGQVLTSDGGFTLS